MNLFLVPILFPILSGCLKRNFCPLSLEKGNGCGFKVQYSVNHTMKDSCIWLTKSKAKRRVEI